MGYRRPDTTDAESSRWRIANRGVLMECGVPIKVVETDRRWTYVLLHGVDELHTGWNPDWISKQQANRLLNLLEKHLCDDTGYDLLRQLRRRIGKPLDEEETIPV